MNDSPNPAISPSAPPDIYRLASARNLQTRGLRDSFASHRRAVTELIVKTLRSQARPDPKLTVLGAGNCLDLDLPAIAEHSSVINLVDIDSDALEFAVRSLPSPISTIRSFAPINLAEPLGDAREAVDEETPFAELARPWIRPPVPMADVVVSLCVLSQILDFAATRFQLPIAKSVVLADQIRRGHLTRMQQVIRPGGTGVLITDIVSSDSLPSLSGHEGVALKRTLHDALAAGNFFRGLHPGVVLSDIQTLIGDDRSSKRAFLSDSSPWLWHIGPRCFAVCAFVFQTGNV